MPRIGALWASRKALLLAVVCALGAATASAQEWGGAAQMAPSQQAQLKDLLEQKPAAGWADKDLAQFFQKQEEAAFKLGDAPARERVLRDWAAAQPGNISPRWNLGMLLIDKGSGATEGFALMEQIYRDSQEPIAAIRVRIKLAGAYLEYGKYTQSKRLLDEAKQRIDEEIKRPRGVEGRYWQVRSQMEYAIAMAQYFQYQGQYAQALAWSQQALTQGDELATTHDRHVSAWLANFSRSNHANAAVSNAMILMQMGDLFAAEEALRHAQGLFKRYGFSEQHLWHLQRTVADLYFLQGRFADSLLIANQVKSAIRAAGWKDNTAQMLWAENRISRALAGQERWQEIVEQRTRIDKSIANDPALKPIAALTEYRAFAYLETGKTEAARNWYRGHLNWAVANIGEDAYSTALTRGMYAVALAKIPGKTDEAKKEFEKAYAALTNAQTLPDVNQEHPFYLKVRKKIYAEYLRLLTQSAGDADQAFVVANALISSSLQKAISEAAARASITQAGLRDLARADQDAKSEQAFLRQFIQEQLSASTAQKPQILEEMRARALELDKIRKTYKSRIEKEFPDYYQLLQPRMPSAAAIAARLGRDEYFMAFVPVQDETLVFGVAADGRIHFHRSQIAQSEIGRIVGDIRSSLDVAAQGARAPRFRYDLAHRLYQDLVAPQAQFMTGVRHLIVASSGDLAQMPYAVLVKAPWPQGSDQNAPWLIKDYAISQITSAQSWMAIRNQPQSPRTGARLLGWGDPAFAAQAAEGPSGAQVRTVLTSRSVRNADLSQPRVDPIVYSKLPPLPETRDEVLALARLMRSESPGNLFLGDKATRQSVIQASESGLLKSGQVIVFATHGLLAGDLPGLSQPALAMAGASHESPLLTLQDVLGLQLNADWVVLSACNTAGADGRNEEALSGLARGFFYAGAKSMLVTHWSVESESASMITTETFKKYIADRQASRAQSLQSAMLKVMGDSRFGHPAFWAPYALVGEGGR